MAPPMGVAAQLGMSPSGAASEAYEFKSESLAARRNIINTAGVRGSRSEVIERLRQGTLAIDGAIVLEPNPNELRKLLPRILGGPETAQTGYFTYALAETLSAFQVVVDRVTKVYTYAGCVVDSAVFRAASGQPVELTLNVEALSESQGAAGTFPALTIDGNPPFTIFDGTLTLAGNVIAFHEVALTIDNRLKKDRFANAQTRTDLPPLGRTVTLRATVEYNALAAALYDGGAAGVPADLRFAVGGPAEGAAGTSLHFVLGNVVFPASKSPAVPGKDEITLLLEGQAFKTGANPELSARVDVTP